MKRDQVIHVLVAAAAQLRRCERLAQSIGSAEELQVRLPPLISDTRRMLESMCSRIEQQEGRSKNENQPNRN